MENLLSDIFDVRSTRLDLDGKTKEMALVDLIDGIAELYPECDRSEMLAAIRERESKMSTGIGNGVAIPHTFCRGISSMAGAIGVSQQGIDFGALDNKPVHVIFLLVIGEHAEENHLRILNKLFKLAQSEVFPQIRNAKDAQAIHAILSQTH